MKQKERIETILGLLDQHYGTDIICYLDHENAWQLLIATILSAQCTDARVNVVTKDLFRKYTGVEAFAKADLKELEQDIRSTGFYHNKAKNIIACCQDLVNKFDGQVPESIEDLTSLAGVGRKTANVIRGNIYNEPSIVEEDPVKVEFDLMKALPKDHWILYNLQIIALGREICKAPTAKCEECFLTEYCPYYKKNAGKQAPAKKKSGAGKGAAR